MAMKSVIDQLIPLAVQHQKADEYISGQYEWDGGACAIGCTIHDAVKLEILPRSTAPGDHKAIAEATGLPEMLWRLADEVFEGLSAELRPAWTPRFLRAAKKSRRPERVPARIMVRLAERLADDALDDQIKQAAVTVGSLWKRRADGDDPAKTEWDAARQQAYATRQQADAAGESWWSWCADMVCEELAK